MRKMKSVERISILSLLFLLSGCITPNKRTPTIYEDGYFKYIYRGENSIYQDINDKAIVIVGFTDLGLEQEVIDIPREINGGHVEQIGMFDESFSHNDTRYLESGSKLKKLYIFENIKAAYFTGQQVDVMACCTEFPFDEERIGSKSLFLYWELYLNIYKNTEILDNQWTKPANVSYFDCNDVGEYSLYRIDNVSDDEKLVEPVSPEKFGRVFDGWFLERECINKFDFNEMPNIKDDSDFALFAGWKTI